MGELGHPVDRQEHEELALGQAQLADVDVHVADLGLGEALALGSLLLALGQPGDAVAYQAAMEGAAGQLRDGVAQAAEDVVERQQCGAEIDDDGFLGFREDGLGAGLGPIGASAVQ